MKKTYLQRLQALQEADRDELRDAYLATRRKARPRHRWRVLAAAAIFAVCAYYGWFGGRSDDRPVLSRHAQAGPDGSLRAENRALRSALMLVARAMAKDEAVQVSLDDGVVTIKPSPRKARDGSLPAIIPDASALAWGGSR